MLIRLHAIDVSSCGAVVELARLDEGNVSEAVPLCTALRVQRVDVVVDIARGNRFDSVLEGLTVEGRDGGDIEREAAGC